MRKTLQSDVFFGKSLVFSSMEMLLATSRRDNLWRNIRC